jgi:hypothetical protein
MNRRSLLACLLSFIGAVLSVSLLLSGCDSDVLGHMDYTAPAAIEYTISGGFAGIHQGTTIDEQGFCEMVDSQDSVIHHQLTDDHLDSLKAAFKEANFFTLKDKYSPPQIVMDGFFYSISYSTNRKSKTVTVEDGADFPEGLGRLLQILHETNWKILSSQDTS